MPTSPVVVSGSAPKLCPIGTPPVPSLIPFAAASAKNAGKYGIRFARMIEQVVRLDTQLQLQPFRNRRVLKDRHIKLPEVRPDERIPPFIAKVEAPGQANLAAGVAQQACKAPQTTSDSKS